MESDRTGIGTLEFLESCFQMGRVGSTIIHDMRRAPYVCNSENFIIFEHSEGFLKGLDAIVHSEKDVAVTVGRP